MPKTSITTSPELNDILKELQKQFKVGSYAKVIEILLPSPELNKTLKKLQKQFKVTSYAEVIEKLVLKYEERGNPQGEKKERELSTNQRKKSTESPILTPHDKQARKIFLKATSKKEATSEKKPFCDLTCPYECRIAEPNMQVFYCANDMKPPFTEKKIRHRQIYKIDRCRQCIGLYEKQLELDALIQEERRAESNASTRPHPDDPAKSLQINENPDYFPCPLLCKKFKGCESRALNSLGEVVADACYVSKYPYEWQTPEGKTVKLCGWMKFEKGDFHDPQNPFPTCRAKQKDVPFQLPKDRAILDPQDCWKCYLDRKAKRKKEQAKERARISRNRDDFKRADFDMGASEGLPLGYDPYYRG